MSFETFGYGRVSTSKQMLDRQINLFENLGIKKENIFLDKSTGINFDRSEYNLLKRTIRKGDLIYIDSFDRLGRTYNESIKEWKYFTKEKEANIVILENPELFDSRKFSAYGDYGKVIEDQFLSLWSFIADIEYQKIKRRQAEGIDAAHKKGVKFGRPKKKLPNNFDDECKKWVTGEQTAVETFTNLGMSKATFYKIIREDKTEYKIY